jgi:hypothetical protein
MRLYFVLILQLLAVIEQRIESRTLTPHAVFDIHLLQPSSNFMHLIYKSVNVFYIRASYTTTVLIVRAVLRKSWVTN